MATMRGGGVGMGMRAERTPHGRAGARRPGRSTQAQAEPEKAVAADQDPGRAANGSARVSASFLMGINRVAGLVMPYTSKPLLDKVLAAGHPELLPAHTSRWSFSAMVVQAITSFSLTQLLSKAGQRLIADMRRQVQRHVGLLSVAYYDENRTGTLVSRIMTDVEGVRNLVGTGLVEFVGGIVTADSCVSLPSAPQRHRHRHVSLRSSAFSYSFCNTRSRKFAPSSANAARSTPRSRDASRSRWAACASSRATTPKTGKLRCLPRASIAFCKT